MSDWICALQTVAFKDNVSSQTIEEDNDLYCSAGDGKLITPSLYIHLLLHFFPQLFRISHLGLQPPLNPISNIQAHISSPHITLNLLFILCLLKAVKIIKTIFLQLAYLLSN